MLPPTTAAALAPTPSPLWVDQGLQPENALLARFDFSQPQQSLGLRALNACAAENWHCADPGAYRIETLQIDAAEDIQAAAARGYRELLARVRDSAQPHLLRIWNYFSGINQGEGDAERYRAFCVGRAAAVDARFHSPPPAATAIGCVDPAHADSLHLIALCAAEPGIALENPRQTPAWRYPREYGPVSPGFSRGVVLGSGAGACLLASGTASIVGHVSLHLGDVEAQLRESLANLRALLDEAEQHSGCRFSLDGCQALRVYLRNPADATRCSAVLAEYFGHAERIALLQGDVCRRELEVELEGVFAAH